MHWGTTGLLPQGSKVCFIPHGRFPGLRTKETDAASRERGGWMSLGDGGEFFLSALRFSRDNTQGRLDLPRLHLRASSATL